jgi:hypothetical protein
LEIFEVLVTGAFNQGDLWSWKRRLLALSESCWNGIQAGFGSSFLSLSKFCFGPLEIF